MGPSTGLEQSLLLLAALRARSVKALRGNGTQCSLLTALREPKEATARGCPGGLYFAIYELEGSNRVGEHRLRHDGQPAAAKEQPSGGPLVV